MYVKISIIKLPFLKTHKVYFIIANSKQDISNVEYKDENDDENSGSSPENIHPSATNVEDVDDTTQENKCEATDDEVSKMSDVTDDKPGSDAQKMVAESDTRDFNESPNKIDPDDDGKSGSELDKHDTSNSDAFEFRDEDSEATDESSLKDQVKFNVSCIFHLFNECLSNSS